MAGGSLLTLLDDIASLLDDVAVMTKKAASKTAGVLGDDLALNAQQVSGVVSNRELPVVWAVAKGSFINKLILVPAALAISVFAPWLITPLLIIGGLYLCFEGVEKLHHQWTHRGHEKTPEEAKAELESLAKDSGDDEKTKIKGAIRTDFVLSAEIIAITLGVVAEPADPKPFGTQVAVLSTIAILMTVGVYGLVAGIVKLDDLGLYLSQRASAAAKSLGKGILWAAPFLMKGLSIAGTAAMFLVGGGIVTHGIPVLHHWIEEIGKGAGGVGGVVPALINGGVGLVAGALVLLLVSGVKKMRGKPVP
jgi:predicted DNA repair protein MutK